MWQAASPNTFTEASLSGDCIVIPGILFVATIESLPAKVVPRGQFTRPMRRQCLAGVGSRSFTAQFVPGLGLCQLMLHFVQALRDEMPSLPVKRFSRSSVEAMMNYYRKWGGTRQRHQTYRNELVRTSVPMAVAGPCPG